MADSKRKKFIVPGNRLRQMQQDLRERKGAYDKNNTDSTGPNRTTQRANFIRMETEGRVGKGAYTRQIGKNTFETNPKKYDERGNLRKKDVGDDFPMSREGSPTVTDTETGETTYGRPKDFKNGGINIHHFASDVDNKKLTNKQLAEKAKIIFDQRNKQADTKEKFKKIKEQREKEMREYDYKRKKPLIDEIAKRRTATEGSFKKGGMMECRGGGIAITGKKFQGVF